MTPPIHHESSQTQNLDHQQEHERSDHERSEHERREHERREHERREHERREHERREHERREHERREQERREQNEKDAATIDAEQQRERNQVAERPEEKTAQQPGKGNVPEAHKAGGHGENFFSKTVNSDMPEGHSLRRGKQMTLICKGQEEE